MELTAVVEALKALKEPCHVVLYTDSQYLQKGITRWIHKWKRNGWKTSGKEPVKNRELWEALDRLVQRHHVEWRWIAGHAGHRENEICDALARAAIPKIPPMTEIEGSVLDVGFPGHGESPVGAVVRVRVILGRYRSERTFAR